MTKENEKIIQHGKKPKAMIFPHIPQCGEEIDLKKYDIGLRGV